MTRCHHSSSTSLLLLVLLSVAPQLPASAASLPASSSSNSPSISSSSGISGHHDTQLQEQPMPMPATASKLGHGAIRTHRRGDDDARNGIHGVAAAPGQSAPPLPSSDVRAAWALASLLMNSMDHPRKEVEVEEEEEEEEEVVKGGGTRERATEAEAGAGEEGGSQERDGGGEQQSFTEDQTETEGEESLETLREEVNLAARELADYKEPSDMARSEQQWGVEEERDQNSTGTWERSRQVEEGVEEEERVSEKLIDDVAIGLSKIGASRDASTLQRQTRGYFQNIDLGLQDNEILPPLKGYKAYNQQLAQATKKLKWQEEKTKEPPALTMAPERNFMDDFDQVPEEDEEVLAREDEEARARAEQDELRRQQAEAEAAREEEQRLADIASDMLLEYMDRKQQTSYKKQLQKASILGNMAEDKRSNEVENDDDDGDLDLQTIDRLIEISSKLHLPADDVVEIISDVEEKKRKKENPMVSIPRFRPLVAPPRPQSPLYKYAPPPPPKVSKPPKPSKSINPYKKWYKEKGKSKVYKQDYWFKPAKQFMAYPSYPYYQKPYRAYYPVYFPPPKPRLYSKPAFAYDYNFEDSLDYGIKPPKRRNMNKLKGKGQSWKVMALGPPAPYISNYIMPHPRTYYSLPMPKPQPPANRRPASPYYYPQDYDTGDLGEQQESDEELENFIEKIYFHRRIF